MLSKALLQQRCYSKRSARVAGAAAGPPQAEVVVAHRRRRVLEITAVAQPYDVCLVPRGDEGNPLAVRRWCPAAWVTPGQLQEYWDNIEAHAFVPPKSPQADLTTTSCKTHKEGPAARRRTKRCGWLYACTPAGYILHLKEYVGAESLPQRYFFVAELIDKVQTLDLIIHDDACHLRKYADARQGDSQAAKRLAFPNVRYVTDRLHAKGHVDQWCLQNCSPTAECNAAVMEHVNSQSCEQLFSQVKLHKSSVRVMGRLTALFF